MQWRLFEHLGFIQLAILCTHVSSCPVGSSATPSPCTHQIPQKYILPTAYVITTRKEKGPWSPKKDKSNLKSQREVEDMLQRVRRCKNCGSAGHTSGHCEDGRPRVIDAGGVYLDPQTGYLEI